MYKCATCGVVGEAKVNNRKELRCSSCYELLNDSMLLPEPSAPIQAPLAAPEPEPVQPVKPAPAATRRKKR